MNTNISEIYEKRAYSNAGNAAVLALVDRDAVTVLDVGCGCGDTAAMLKARDPHKQIDGITISPLEAKAASTRLNQCWVADVESAVPVQLSSRAARYDTLIFSHVLEHMRDPQRVVERLVPLLKPAGRCIIAVPNVMVYRQRWDFLCGRFEYQAHGLMDETHLRFFTYYTASQLLLRAPSLELERISVTGNAPLWRLRRYLSANAVAKIDARACKNWPNLFGSEVLLVCKKRG